MSLVLGAFKSMGGAVQLAGGSIYSGFSLQKNSS